MSPSQAAQRSQRSSPDRNQSIEALYHDHERRLRLWLESRVLPSTVDDVSQAVWERVVAKYQTHFDGGNFRAWIFQIARNYLVDLNRRRRESSPLDEEPPAPTDSPIDILIQEEYRQRLTACMQTLGHPRKAVVESRLAGVGYEDCAAALKLSIQQARQHFFAAKEKLRACMSSRMKETA